MKCCKIRHILVFKIGRYNNNFILCIFICPSSIFLPIIRNKMAALEIFSSNEAFDACTKFMLWAFLCSIIHHLIITFTFLYTFLMLMPWCVHLFNVEGKSHSIRSGILQFQQVPHYLLTMVWLYKDKYKEISNVFFISLSATALHTSCMVSAIVKLVLVKFK